MSRSHKVCHLTTVHSRNDIRIFQKQCVSLAQKGYDVVLLTGDQSPDEMVSGVKIVGVKNSAKNRFFRMAFGVVKMLRQAVREKAALYHFHDPELIPVGLCLRLLGKKVVYDVHEDVPMDILTKYWIRPYLRKGIAVLFQTMENISVRYFSAICVVSKSIERRFILLNKRVVVIFNYPIIWLDNQKRLMKSDQDNAYICYVGGIDKIRGIVPLIKALPSVKGMLHLAGNFTSEGLKNELQFEKGWTKVVEHGFVGRDKVNKIFFESSVGIITFLPVPNHINAVPNKIFEYMAAGLPVVASNFPGWTAIIEKNNCGICVDPENPSKIAESINYLLTHEDVAEKMGQNGRKNVIEQYNWKIEEKKLFDLYKELLKEEL